MENPHPFHVNSQVPQKSDKKTQKEENILTKDATWKERSKNAYDYLEARNADH